MVTRSFYVVALRILPIAIGALIAYCVCAHGVPLLRHDWGLPQAPAALPAAWETLFQPLILRGLGETNAYPTPYLVGFVTMPLALLPPVVFVWLFVALISASAAAAAATLARNVGAGPVAQSACMLFATFNPWAYTELVAGHVLMVMAYGFLIWLVAETLRTNPRSTWLVLWSALLVCQIEFLAFALVPLAVWLFRRRHYPALLALFIAAVPIAFGILAHYDEIRETPFLLEWQVSQSIAILDALTFRGYFAQYATAFGSVAPALWITAIAAAIATVTGIARKWGGWPLFVLGWCALVLATGTKWIVAPLYSLAVLNIQEIGVFRELYDLLALSAIAYMVGIAWVGKSYRYASLVLLAACIALIYPWIVRPPFAHFVPQAQVPTQNLPGSDQQRVALFPAQQPLNLRSDGGSGYDPDLFYQPGRAIPVNSYFPTFPQVSALAAAQSGDFLQLSALSVRYVIGRPYLRENLESQRYEMIAPRVRPVLHTQTLPQAYPMLGLVPGFPAVVTIGRMPLGNGVFFGDASSDARVENVSAPRLGTNAKKGWIDARLAYVSYPALATQFGGAFTRGGRPLPIMRDVNAVLAWTSNALRNDSGVVITRAATRLHWYQLPHDTRSLVCSGACMVSAVGSPPPLKEEASASLPVPVAFDWITPWLIHASLPAHAESTLRWNVRYDPSWALVGTGTITHLRIDEAVNGWTLPAGAAASIYLVDSSAGIQTLLEVCSFLFICTLLWRTARNA